MQPGTPAQPLRTVTELAELLGGRSGEGVRKCLKRLKIQPAASAGRIPLYPEEPTLSDLRATMRNPNATAIAA